MWVNVLVSEAIGGCVVERASEWAGERVLR